MSKFTPSPAEVHLVNQIFAQADTQKLGVITGDAAVKIFSGSKLSPTVLADIWNLADEDNNGVLTRKGVAVAVRLLGHAQRGEQITEALVNRPCPPPAIEGLTPPLIPQSTGIPSAKSPPPGFPPLTAQDKGKFMKMFVGYGPTNGVLAGDKARDVFVKSKLPVDKLSQIWNLADTKNRGALDATDFTIAMYLIQACMSGQVHTLPATLPPGLYEQAGGKGPFDGVAVHTTGGSSTYSPSLNSSFPRPVSMLEPQYTGQGSPLQPQMTGPMRSTPTAPSLPPRSALSNAATASAFPFLQQQTTGATQQPWDVTPAEKASADRLFEGLDTQKRGYIEGDIAVPFMLLSKLPEDVLAHVWDLADLNNDGRLTRDGFAVAMHLIQSRLNGKEVPASIPLTLIPPSMRGAAPGQAPPPQPSVQDSIRDLIWDDSPPASATMPPPQQPALQPQATGTLSSRTPIASPPMRSQTISDPFASSTPVATRSPFAMPPPAVHHDLLGDDDEPAQTASPPLHDQSAEIGNVKNQLNSTNRSLEVAKAERDDMERKLSEQASQLAALQTQLSSAKAAYETETRLLSALRERYNAQTMEMQQARENLIRGESDLSAVRVEKAEIEGSFLRDKEDVRELQRKMTEVYMEVETLKAGVEKAKKEAKQQKGLLAIARKQLATREAERAKIQKELEEAHIELTDVTKELEEVQAKAAEEVPAPMTNGRGVASPDILARALAQPLPATPDIPTSPTGSVMSLGKSNNPFERVAMASSPGSRSQSPFLPFTNSAMLPTPPTAGGNASKEAEESTPVVAASPNPFRFSQAFSPEQVFSSLEAPAEAQLGVSPIDLMSPTDTDMFHTPPSSATLTALSPMPQPLHEGADLEAPASTDTIVPTGPQASEHDELVEAPTNVNDQQQDTDLGHQLKELEVEESDSDSDSESSDDEPLATIKAPTGPEPTIAEQPDAAGTSSIPEISAFDDSFGITTEDTRPLSSFLPAAATPVRSDSLATSVQPVDAQPAPDDAFAAAFGTPSAPTTAPVAPASSASVDTAQKTNGFVAETPGVDDFDEAMGKISAVSSTNGGQSQPTQFDFGSAFDDNFDFAAATAVTTSVPATNDTNANMVPAQATPNAFDSVFVSQPAVNAAQPPAPAVRLQTTGTSPFEQPSGPETRPFSFDDAFGATSIQPHPSSSQPGSSNPSHGISFDDAFGGRNSVLALDTSYTSTSSQSQQAPPPAQPRTSAAFPTTSPPLSPVRAASPPLDARRSSSPARRMSPPPRHSSPKPRPSTASSDKEKAPSHRTSKLSIRLPFGRKKKAHDIPPVPPPLTSQHLVEEPTPSADDDLPAVKQLCGMGFSRTQAVTALELHDYDLQRALNSLLGSS
ncbi:hypothetical protein POSPLADRAFT_1166744 [Postia placenta MAD-698-R-SB12]|uniref:Uncharacterized protein n=1 Tax=Postia placenta MAD-698-R-SB12 TaxID=670580 RepID=A0A1X6N7M8_9APHY|nr:hypothetical protein POSPLADRAFT_1166744 [Postia placenta MAD-698-R-SB12]OSX64638.1 hypothetical protein POSPLADRAFT_1166744 [Postia placenta MAD-698-R-SB12]